MSEVQGKMPEKATHPTLSVVVPCYYESTGLLGLYDAINENLGATEPSWELILVDDGSGDDTWEVIGSLCDRFGNVRGRRFSRNFGKDAALLAGLELASGDAAITMDADQQHPPTLLPSMVELWRSGANIVDCVKVNRAGQGALSRQFSRAYNTIFESLTGIRLRDATDFKLLDRKALASLMRLGEKEFFFRGATAWVGLNRATLPFEVEDRASGTSKYGFFRLMRLGISGLTSYSSKPLHLITGAGLVFGAFSVLLALQTLLRFLRGDAAEGFTTVILILLTIGTFLMLGLGIIGEYLARIYEEVRARPRFIVSEER